MDSVSSSTVNQAASADVSTVQGSVAVAMLKKSLNLQAASAVQLLQALPQPALATSGALGTQVNTYA